MKQVNFTLIFCYILSAGNQTSAQANPKLQQTLARGADSLLIVVQTAKDDTNKVKTINLLSTYLWRQKKYDEAVMLCMKLLQQYPDYASARKNLSLIFADWKDQNKVNYYRGLLAEKGISLP